MSKKKVTIEEWNKELFHKIAKKDFNKITKIIPCFEKWTTSLEDEDETQEWQEIAGIDLEFEDGSKIRISPKSNRPEDEELSLALDIVEYRPQSINWRDGKGR